MDFLSVRTILESAVKPALGCTEPASIAFAAAVGGELVGKPITSVSVDLSENIAKNAQNVKIPCSTIQGVETAAGLGALLSNPDRELELFWELTPELVHEVDTLRKEGRLKARVVPSNGFYIHCSVTGKRGMAETFLRKGHASISETRLNEETLFQSTLPDPPPVSSIPFSELVSIAQQIPVEHLEWLSPSIEMNARASREGSQKAYGMGLGHFLDTCYPGNAELPLFVRKGVAGACDVRMSGSCFSIATVMGSGNQGIATILPAYLVGKRQNLPQEQVLRAVAMSILLTVSLKEKMGKLSPMCGGIIAAIGSAVACSWLLGASLQQMAFAAKNIVGNLTGVVCDGAKEGCCLKISTGSAEAVLSAQMALQNVSVPEGNGIVSANIDRTLENFAQISSRGMKEMDALILNLTDCGISST
ncbi:MAG TPA: L-serine ammonia-lyase, iron-sulfur-dependent, subunit alpha [Thermotogota bacterium]|nr:L-serine ammonia-lyase, iron-sulfur-dependent, subunit alpha [Thermotogota bacterium]HRW92138.1 L-serine ammonia-lyase, iron-sulfur-dependent, subunit alpha [Thermotogota bacterium]